MVLLFRRFRIQTRLIIILFFVSLIPLFSASWFFYFQHYPNYRNIVIQDNKKIVDQVRSQVQYSVSRNINTVINFATNRKLTLILKNYHNADFSAQYLYSRQIDDLLSSIRNSIDSLEGVDVCTTQSLVTFAFQHLLDFEVSQNELFQAGMEPGKPFSVISTKVYEGSANKIQAYIIISKVTDENGKIVGLVSFAISDKALSRMLYDTVSQSSIYIADREGRIVSHRVPEMVMDTQDPEITALFVEDAGATHFIGKGGNRRMVHFAPIARTGWFVVSDSNYAHLVGDINATILRNSILIVVVVCVVFILNFWMTRSIIQPMDTILSACREIEHSNFDITVEDYGADEINTLTRAFNRMTNRIHTLIDEVTKSHEQKRMVEIQMLTAQMNPHFLYNTLDLISWMGYSSKQEDICTLVENLSQFYRLSLNRGNEYYTLQDELSHVKSYIAIQKLRMQERIRYHFDIDEDVLESRTIKFLLQPLVENAISHGLQEKGSGDITLRIKSHGERIALEVSDNGSGFKGSPEAALQSPAAKGSFNYGLWNINERLIRYHGPEYRLKIITERGIGTTIHFALPVSGPEPEENAGAV
jgi:two-component system sensor histidine kinase YesM